MDKNLELSKLFADEAFKKEAEGLTSVEELQALFAKHDVEMDKEEVLKLCETIAKQMETTDADANGELSEACLENVAGGFAITASVVMLGVACIGSLALGIYNGYKSTKPAHT